jgi:PAS domain-containing protein
MVRQPLCFCGLDGLVWESNQAFCQLLGYSNKSEVRRHALKYTLTLNPKP